MPFIKHILHLLRYFFTLYLLLNIVNSFGQYSSCYINPNQPNACFSAQPFPTVNFAIEKNFETVDNTAVYQSQLLMDVDGDCIPEIIMAGTVNASTSPRFTSSIKIINSVTGATKYNIPTAHFSWSAGNSFAIADLDYNGIPEIVVAAVDNAINPPNVAGRLVCYNIDGSIKWISDQQFGNNTTYRYGGTVGFADFNKDGIPEVYIYNEIFNAQTGVKLAHGGANGLGLGRQSSANEGSLSLTIAAHLDADTNNLELAAGYTIYKVNIVNPLGMAGNSMTPYNINVDGLLRDGLTTIADINQDGQLDVIVTSRGNDVDARLYSYYLDGTTPTLIARTTLPNGGGPQEGHVGTPFTGDIDGSGTPTIGLTRAYRLLTYKYNGTQTFQLNWMVNTNDQSGETGLTMFDFNQDGTQEIVYRDETDLKIINGSGLAPVTLAFFTCTSGTGLERPIVGDIDNTGTTKICVSCGPQITGKVEVFSAPTGQQAWAPSRAIWNQYGYHIFNINDDLTVPQYPFNNATFANGMNNNFFVQASFIDSTGFFYQWAANLNAIIHCVNYNPQTNLYTVVFDLYNDSNATLDAPPGVPIAFFNGNPETTGALIGLYYTNTQINIGQTISNLTYTFSGGGLSNFTQLYVVVNTDGSQTGVPYLPQFFDLAECDYINNIENAPIIPPTNITDSICSGQSYIFNGQNITSSGTYYQYLSNASGCDSVVVLNLTVFANPPVNAGNDQIICVNQSVNLTAFGTGSYLWSTGSPTQSINVSPLQTTTYTVTVTDTNGCSASDAVVVNVNPLPNANAGVDTAICYGHSTQLSASGGITYLWAPATGLNFANIHNPVATPSVPTTYNLTVTDANGCSNTDNVYVNVYALPQAFAGNDTAICYGNNVTFNATGGVLYAWSSGHNTASITVSPASTTTYIVTVTDAFGCSNTDAVVLTVFTLPVVQTSNDTTVCYGSTVQLSASGGVIYNWSPSATLNNSTISNPIATPQQSTTYTVVVTDINSCSASGEVIIVVNPLPQVFGGGHQSICIGDTATFTATGGINYAWSTGDTQSVIIVSPQASTTYTVTASDNMGCTNTSAAFLTVNLWPQAFAGADTSICPNTPAYLNASGGIIYVWSPSTGLSGINTHNPVASPSSPITYTVTVTDANGCSATDDVSIGFYESPVVMFIPDVYNGCAPLQVTFNDSVSGNISTWAWNFGDPASGNANISSLPQPTHTYTTEGVYSVALTLNTTDGCQNTVIYNNLITVYPNPTANFTATPMITDIYQPTITFSNNSTGAVSYYWNFGDNTTSNIINPTHTYTCEGSFTVKLLVANQYGCVDSCLRVILIKPEFNFYIPTGFTPNGDGYNDFFGGIGSNFTDYQLYIFDRWGELIYESNDYHKPWNGKYWNEKEINVIDVFVYKIVVKDYSGKKHVYIGHVTLLK